MSIINLIPNYLRIVTDKATNSYRLEFYNTTTGTWEVVLEIDPVSKIIKVHPTFNDDLKLFFGAKGYSIRFDSSADGFVVRDEVNDTDILVIGRNGDIKSIGKIVQSTLQINADTPALRLTGTEAGAVDIRIVEDAGKFKIQYWDGATWVDKLVIDGATGRIELIGELADDLKLFFGTDRDFSIRYDATNDNLRIRDELNATEIIVPRNQNRNLGQFSKYRKAEETAGVGIGVAGSPATIVSLDVTDPDFMNLMPLKVTATPSGLGTAESATFRVNATLDDGTTVTLAERTTAAGSTATETFLVTDFDFALIPDGRRIVRLELTAESSATSTTATATGAISAIEHD